MASQYKSIISALFFIISCNAVASEGGSSGIKCTPEDAPKNIQPIANFSMIAPGTVEIATADAFSGKYIKYSISAPVTNPANILKIKIKNGTLLIQAVAKDEFDATVTATNPCGSASVVFSVKID